MKKYSSFSNLKPFLKAHKICGLAYLDAKDFSSHLGPRHDGREQIEHPLSVADTLLNLFPNDLERTKKLVTVALLHDLIEDTTADYMFLKQRYGEEVADSVKTLTHAPHLSKTGKKGKILLKAMLKMDEDTLLVKLADRLDNIETLYAMPEQKIKQTVIDTNVILNGLVEEKTDLTTEHKDLIDLIAINLKEYYEKSR